jgi:CAAX prenyl protease-like protein
MKHVLKNPLFKRPWAPYVFPFAFFLVPTGLVRFLPDWSPFLYITRTLIVGALLWFWRHEYSHDIKHKLSFNEWCVAFCSGLLVLAIWIIPESFLPWFTTHEGFNPYAFGWSKKATIGLIALRMIGLSVVVPIMEELFWRSFLMRYLINPDFRRVTLGTFTWFSFIGVTILFGLEHHQVIQGIIAGIVYTLLLIHQKKLRGCILSHGVTNLGLGIYILATESWMFW